MWSLRAGMVIGTLAVLLCMPEAGQASLAFNPTSLTFQAQQGANPQAQSIQVTAAPGGSNPGNWTITVSTASGGSWLSASPTLGQGLASVSVSVNVAGLAAGTYTGTVSVGGVLDGGATASVTLQVAAATVVGLSPASLSFSGQAGGNNPAIQTLQVSSPAGTSAPATWTTSVSTTSGGSWLTATPATGQGSGSITVGVNIAGLAGGTYNGTVTVTEAGAGTATANVTLQLSAAPIALTLTTLNFTGQVGGTNPAPQTTQVSNPGSASAPFNWNVSVATTSGGNWLSASPSSGSGTGNVTVSVNLTGLAAGTYSGAVTVSVTGVGSAAANVTLQLSANSNAPTINPGGLVNGASFSKLPPAAATIASLFGTKLAPTTAVATSLPLPTVLGGVSVIIKSVTTTQSGVTTKSVLPVGGITAPLFSVSPDQINFEVPVELGDQTQATAAVSVNGIVGNTITFNVSQYNPAIFAVNQQGSGQGAILISTTGELSAPIGSVTGVAARPVKRGEFITIYCTGLGPVTHQPVDGAAALSNPLSVTTTTPTITIGGNPVPVSNGSFSGLAPNYVGLYQVNVPVTGSVAPGDAVTVKLNIGGVDSNTVTIAVQ